MEQVLERKLKEEKFVCTEKELIWLIKHIGDENPTIRDSIVFNSLARGLTENSFTTNQFSTLKNATIESNLINYKIREALPSTLIRSFSALLNGFIIQVDGDESSLYYNLLSSQERDYFFSNSLNYLISEHDYVGFSSKYGWVHGIAHGADYLSKVTLHHKFPSERTIEVFSAIEHVFLNIENPFIEGEDRRLAVIIYKLILVNKLDISAFIFWIEGLSFPLETNRDFYRMACFENFLAAIYFHLEGKNSLDKDLRKVLLSLLKEY